MPRGDRTGPRGYGPMTGRAAGYCAGYPIPGYMNITCGFGRGFGRGRNRGFGKGRGSGFGRGWQEYPTIIQPQSPEQEIETLEAHQKNLESKKADLEGELKEINSRIEKLKATPKQ